MKTKNNYISKRTIKALQMNATVEVHPNIAEQYRTKINKLRRLLTDETKRIQAMDLIRSMIERIEVHEGEERGNPEVILTGGLAQILVYTQQNTAAPDKGDGGRCFMVAGARSQRFRTRVSTFVETVT